MLSGKTRRGISAAAAAAAALFLLLCIYPGDLSAMIYKWVDKDGGTHFSDTLAGIPKEYWKQVGLIDDEPVREPVRETSEKSLEEEKNPAPPPSPPEESKVKGVVPASDPKAVDLVGQVITTQTAAKTTRFTGKAANRTAIQLDSVEIHLSLFVRGGKEIKTLSAPVSGAKGNAFLAPAEKGSFEVVYNAPLSSLSRYEYKFTWKYTTEEKK